MQIKDSEYLQAEYNQLKKKIETRVKDLEGKVVDPNKTMTSVSATCLVHGHRHYHCHHNCQATQPQYMNYNGNNIDRNQNFVPLSSRMTDQSPDANNSLTKSFLRQNLKLQKEMNQNLRALSERISDLSVKKSDSSAFLDDQNYNIERNRKNNSGLNRLDKRQSRYGSSQKARSLANYPIVKPNLSKENDLHSYKSRNSKNSDRNKSRNKLKIKKKVEETHGINCDQEYYIIQDHREKEMCPVHEAKKMKSKYKMKQKNHQIYKDSQHRNKKHEKDHLMSSYYQQQKSRKQLLAKVAKNFFTTYGFK